MMRLTDGLDGPLRVRHPVHQSSVQWSTPGRPQGSYVQGVETSAGCIDKFFPSVAARADQYWPADASAIEKEQLRAAIRAEFRRRPSLEDDSVKDDRATGTTTINDAFSALRTLVRKKQPEAARSRH